MAAPKKNLIDELHADLDEMFRQASRRHNEREKILGDWLCDEITSIECTERLKNIKFHD